MKTLKHTLASIALAAAATLGFSQKAQAQQVCTFPPQVVAHVQRYYESGAQEGAPVPLVDSDRDGALDARIGYLFTPNRAGKYFKILTAPGYPADPDSISYSQLAGRDTTVAGTITAGGVNGLVQGPCLLAQPFRISFDGTIPQPQAPTQDTVQPQAEPAPTTIIVAPQPEPKRHAPPVHEPYSRIRRERRDEHREHTPAPRHEEPSGFLVVGPAVGYQSTTADKEHNPLTEPPNFPGTSAETGNWNVGVAYQQVIAPSDEFFIDLQAGAYKTFGSTEHEQVSWNPQRSAYEKSFGAKQDVSGHDVHFGGRVAFQPSTLGVAGNLSVRVTGTDHTQVSTTQETRASVSSTQLSGSIEGRLRANPKLYFTGGLAAETNGGAAEGTGTDLFAKLGMEYNPLLRDGQPRVDLAVYAPTEGQDDNTIYRQVISGDIAVTFPIGKHVAISGSGSLGVINAPFTQTSYGHGQLSVQYRH